MLDSRVAEAGALARGQRGVLARLMAPVQSLATFGRHKPLGAVGGAIFLLLVLMAIFAGPIAPYGDREIHPDAVFAPPQKDFLFGTDHVGRDLLSRVIFGARISLYVGGLSVLFGITAGFAIGLASTYAAGAIDMAVQRVVDALLALPGLIVALAIMAVLGASLNNVVIAIVVGMLAPVIRTIRSQVLSLKELDYVLAAQAIGASSKRIIFRHIAPNAFATCLVLGTYYLGYAIIIEASLSFLGVGSPPDIPSWGTVLARTTEYHLKTAPWIGIFPGIAIFIVVMGFNLLGDALRDVFDPKLRGR